jgi:hypothetical protein
MNSVSTTFSCALAGDTGHAIATIAATAAIHQWRSPQEFIISFEWMFNQQPAGRARLKAGQVRTNQKKAILRASALQLGTIVSAA